MPVYTVHGPITGTASAAPERIAFVRDGFSFWAFLAGPFWLIWHRLWWALLGYMVVVTCVSLTMSALGLPPDTRILINLAIALLMGFEAASLRRWTLSRRKWRQIDVVGAADRDAAERRFFDRWTGRVVANEPSDRGSPPPTRTPFMPATAPRDDIIGLFPQPGGAPR